MVRTSHHPPRSTPDKEDIVKAEVAFAALLTAARALKAYTTSPRRYTATRLLYLHSRGDTLTLTAGTGEDAAQVDLPGAYADGACAITPDILVKALTATRPKGKAARTATVSLLGEPDRLHLTVTGGPTVSLDTETSPPGPAHLPLSTTGTARQVTTGPARDWCDLLRAVGWAAGHDPSRPDLAVVRLRRDHPGTVLMVEAVDRYRAHRGRWGRPTGEPVDIRIPADAAQRAVTLLVACDPHGQLRVDAGEEHVWWQTGSVRVCAGTRSGPFPDLEQTREDTVSDATTRFTVDRQQLLAVLDTAAALAATTRRGVLRIEPATTGRAVDVTVPADSGGPLHRTPVPALATSGPAHPLTFNAGFARQAVAFLDGHTVAVAADVERLAVYLRGTDRHAILMQTAS